MLVALALATSSPLSAEQGPDAVEDGQAERDGAPPPFPVATPLVEDGEPSPGRSWYGWQILVADGVNVGLLLIAGRELGPVSGVNLLGYLGSGPLIHAYHRRSGRAYGSLALRAGAPLLGHAVFGLGGRDEAVTLSGDEPSGGSRTPLWRELLPFAGAPIAMAIDWLALGWSAERGSRDRPRRAISPTAAVTPAGFQLGLKGMF